MIRTSLGALLQLPNHPPSRKKWESVMIKCPLAEKAAGIKPSVRQMPSGNCPLEKMILSFMQGSPFIKVKMAGERGKRERVKEGVGGYEGLKEGFWKPRLLVSPLSKVSHFPGRGK